MASKLGTHLHTVFRKKIPKYYTDDNNNNKTDNVNVNVVGSGS